MNAATIEWVVSDHQVLLKIRKERVAVSRQETSVKKQLFFPLHALDREKDWRRQLFQDLRYITDIVR